MKREATTARDPNEKLVSPEGEVGPGDKLNYTINYENEGEGIIYRNTMNNLTSLQRG